MRGIADACKHAPTAFKFLMKLTQTILPSVRGITHIKHAFSNSFRVDTSVSCRDPQNMSELASASAVIKSVVFISSQSLVSNLNLDVRYIRHPWTSAEDHFDRIFVCSLVALCRVARTDDYFLVLTCSEKGRRKAQYNVFQVTSLIQFRSNERLTPKRFRHLFLNRNSIPIPIP